MGLETVTYINDLDPANPTSTDPKSQGDNHIRNIKSAVVTTFPNIDGAVTVSQNELNTLEGVSGVPVQDQIDALESDKYEKTGGDITGEVNVVPPSGDSVLSLSRAAGSNRRLRGRTGTSLRWTLDMGDNAAEAGSNAGSDFAVSRYNDAGTLLAVALKIARGTGAVTVPGAVSLGSTLAVDGASTFTGAVTVPTPTATGHATNQQWVVDYVASQASSGTTILRESRTSNTAIAATDVGKWLDCTGSFTQTFNSCSSLGNGFWCYLGNSGTGDVTIDPNGSETFDGITSFIMYPGEARLVQCNGTLLSSIVLQGFKKTFTTSGDFIAPPGYGPTGVCHVDGHMWGSGGAGSATSGGGGGAYEPLSLRLTPGTTYPAVVAAGPATGSGSASTFAGASAAGGGAGASPGIAPGFEPPVAIADRNSSYSGGKGGMGSSAPGNDGGNSFFGGAGGARTGRVLGVSRLGGNGGGTGQAAQAPGGGGGETSSGNQPGARGELRLWGVV